MRAMVRENGGDSGFPPTAWTLLAGFAAGGSARERALGHLASRYWMPVYVYLRQKGRTEVDSQDLVQSFFLHLIEKDLLARPDPARGRFRSWLLAVLEHFLADASRYRRARKRGGKTNFVPLDSEAGEFAVRSGGESTPEEAFARTWALGIFQRAFEKLEQELESSGREAVLAKLRLRMRLPGGSDASPDVSNVAVHRARKRLKALVLAEVGDSVQDPREVASEVADLFRALGSRP